MYNINIDKLVEQIESGTNMSKLVNDAFTDFLRFDNDFISTKPPLYLFLVEVGVIEPIEKLGVSRHNFLKNGA
jgi:hypothetical protein